MLPVNENTLPESIKTIAPMSAANLGNFICRKKRYWNMPIRNKSRILCRVSARAEEKKKYNELRGLKIPRFKSAANGIPVKI